MTLGAGTQQSFSNRQGRCYKVGSRQHFVMGTCSNGSTDAKILRMAVLMVWQTRGLCMSLCDCWGSLTAACMSPAALVSLSMHLQPLPWPGALAVCSRCSVSLKTSVPVLQGCMQSMLSLCGAVSPTTELMSGSAGCVVRGLCPPKNNRAPSCVRADAAKATWTSQSAVAHAQGQQVCKLFS